ncbi:MAG: M48 family peptidase, partial [Psychromonas sp.]
TEKAIQILTPYQLNMPENEIVTLNLVFALQKEKKYQQADILLQRFLRTHPDHILAHQLAIELNFTMKNRAKEHAYRAQYLALQGRFRKASQEMGVALVYAKSNLDQARYSAYIELYRKQDLRLQSLQE